MLLVVDGWGSKSDHSVLASFDRVVLGSMGT
jgi:hypothetical protein